MPKLKILTKDKEYNLNVVQGEVLSKILQDNSIDIIFPCGQNGRCCKCLIKVISGDVPASETDLARLSADEINEGFRASCRAYIKDDLTIEIMERNLFQES